MKRRPIPTEQLSVETRHLFDVLNNESDLACVVIGAAFIDTALASLLARKFIASSVSDKMLASTGVLGTFSTRADLAYCLGLIKKKSQYKDILIVGRIRNQFAHNHLKLSFKEPEIRELCNQLNEWRVVSLEEEKFGIQTILLEATEEQLQNIARNQFNLSVTFLANWILLYALGVH